MATAGRQFEHEDVATVPRGHKVRTAMNPSGHRLRSAYPPGPRRNSSQPNAKTGKPAANPRSKSKTREQVEAMQAKAVKFLRGVVGDDAKADEIEGLSVAEYAERKKITLANAGTKGKRPGASKKKKRRRNADDATKLYQTFHGKSPKEVLDVQESAAIRGEFTSLGELVELVVKSVGQEDLRLGFEGEKVKLASSPAGTQLYCIGGNQVLDGSLKRFGADTSKDFVELGIAQSIVYRAAKDFTDFKSTDWEHEFGEESGDKPHVFYDKFKHRIFLMGGRYRVERPGIID